VRRGNSNRKSKTENPKSKELPDFPDWLKQVSPHWTWNWAHQIYLYEKLAMVTTGQCKRLMIFMPPRHSKSETVTVHYSAWRLEREEHLNIILGSYNQKLANRFSRRIKRLAETRLPISSERKASEEWETKAGGGVRAVGVGAGVTGFGAKLIMIDDPVKNRAQAESERCRENCWDWFNDDIYTRLEPGGAIILTQTRWHDDDLAGRLIREMKEEGGEDWTVVNLPALAEETGPECSAADPAAVSEGDSPSVRVEERVRAGRPHDSRRVAGATGDPLGREPGQALCPDRYDEEALLRIKNKLGAYSFAALYQQRPIPHEGALFKRKWFTGKIVDKAPRGLTRWVRGYDLAVSTKTSADYTASFRCAYDNDGNLFIADGFRERIEYPEQRRYVVGRMTSEKNTEHGIEKALHGQAFVQDLRQMRQVRGVPFKAVRVESDKYTRALAWANLAEEGRVYLVQGAWINAFLDEICRFTGRGDAHDDQVDAVSLAVGLLAKPRGKSFGW
jgi:predicted phage terminase large subunit-like protein